MMFFVSEKRLKNAAESVLRRHMLSLENRLDIMISDRFEEIEGALCENLDSAVDNAEKQLRSDIDHMRTTVTNQERFCLDFFLSIPRRITSELNDRVEKESFIDRLVDRLRKRVI